jgi:pimeloyl-ACP methyl ester carboxylesterase
VSASYRTSSLQVRGGELAMGLWNMPGSAEVAADGPVVVLIHGITSAHTAWPLVVDHLPAGTRVLAPDLRGRGRSNGLPAPYGMEQHCADVLAMMDHFGVRKATLVGHSMGASRSPSPARTPSGSRGCSSSTAVCRSTCPRGWTSTRSSTRCWGRRRNA